MSVPKPDSPYRVAFLDWLACACGGAGERAARAVRESDAGLLADVSFAATAGHVLDFDDTFSEGVAHVSAASAPAALVLAAQLGHTLGAALAAYAEGYEAMAAVAAASHPALYNAGWHPTAVCAPIGAAIASVRISSSFSSTRSHVRPLTSTRSTTGCRRSSRSRIALRARSCTGRHTCATSRRSTPPPARARGA